MTELTRALIEHRQGRLSWDAFCRQAFSHIDTTLTRPLGIHAEGRQDILGEFYPRFLRLCSDYAECGSSFDAYLFTSLRFFVRTWQRERIVRLRTETALACHAPDELSVSEDPSDPIVSPQAHQESAVLTNTRQRDTVRRQLLICLCKNLPLLSQDEIDYYAILFGLPGSWLHDFETCLHARRERVSRARTTYREYRDRHYAAMLHYQIFPERSRHASYDLVEFHRRRWRYYRRRLERQTVHLTNREVASILGIPKGSVDSALSNLSRRLAQRGLTQIPSDHATEDITGIE